MPQVTFLNISHPSIDNTNRFPKDQFLRRNGWRILSRKKGQPAIWISKDGKELPLEKVLDLLGYSKTSY